MARRGFFAELQHQSRVAARDRERAERVAVREHQAAIRLAEQTRKAAQRLQAEMARATSAEMKRLEKEARESHIAAMEAEVDERNKKLEDDYSQIDSILAATLGVDDFVDLKKLRVVAKHPPFDRPELEIPIPKPAEIPFPAPPDLVLPQPTKGIFAALFGKKKHQAAVASAKAAHERAFADHQKKREHVVVLRREALSGHARKEADRAAALSAAQTAFAKACQERVTEADERNKSLGELIVNLGYGTAEAVQEYVSIVLANSVYPECFPATHEFSFDPAVAELNLKVLVPGPDKVPTVKAYKYTKSADEISESTLSQKASRDRYEGAVHQVALRSIHEVFEADRRGLIKTISLTVGTETIDPATGRHTYVPFVVVGAEREAFLAFDLSAVVPESTLSHLGAAVSKNPYALAPADTTGVRRS
jgi:restriction system protein